jgi:hypothetical protein
LLISIRLIGLCLILLLDAIVASGCKRFHGLGGQACFADKKKLASYDVKYILQLHQLGYLQLRNVSSKISLISSDTPFFSCAVFELLVEECVIQVIKL